MKARVMSKQPKRTGLNKSRVNVFVKGDKKPSSQYWDKIADAKKKNFKS